VHVPSVFELNSIKDQLSLLAALKSHIDFDELEEKDLNNDYGILLNKMNNAAKNLTEKLDHLKQLLDG
jgi:hypothetical protein